MNWRSWNLLDALYGLVLAGFTIGDIVHGNPNRAQFGLTAFLAGWLLARAVTRKDPQCQP